MSSAKKLLFAEYYKKKEGWLKRITNDMRQEVNNKITETRELHGKKSLENDSVRPYVKMWFLRRKLKESVRDDERL